MSDDQVTVRGSVKRSPNSAHCHKLIASVAKAAAHELYDTLMMDQMLYDVWRKRYSNLSPKKLEEKFVAKHWGRCIPFARATLAAMLRTGIDDAQKESIVEALALDATLMRGRVDSRAVAPPSLRELMN